MLVHGIDSHRHIFVDQEQPPGFERVCPDSTNASILCLQELLSLHTMPHQGPVSQRVKVQVACRCTDEGVIKIACVRALKTERVDAACKSKVGVLSDLYLLKRHRCHLANVPVHHYKERIDG